MTQYQWEGRDELVRRAKKRGLRVVAIAAALGVLAAVLGAVLPHHHQHSHRHTHTGAGIAVGVVVVVVYVVVVLIAILVSRRRGRRLIAGRPLQGLSFRDQRRVGRAIRSGTPSSDPLLANVEHEIADRLVRANPKLVAIGVAVLGLAYLSAAVLTPIVASRAAAACLALLTPVMYLLYRRQVARARRYLQAADRADTNS